VTDAADFSLAARYDLPAPRYTSYPTVPDWDSTPDASQWLDHLARSLDAPQASAALYVHVPFCRSLCTYCGCNTRITRSHSMVAPYVRALLGELELYARGLGRTQLPVSELYLGGGTPTFLTPAELTELLSGLFERVRLQPGARVWIEADPRVTTPAQLELLSHHGFRGLSLGVEDLDSRVQQMVNRVQSEQQLREVVLAARSVGFECIHFDLIYGLPLQSADSVNRSMDAVGRLRPERVALYGYTHVPWIKPGQRRFTDGDLPEPEARRALAQLGRARLEALGYREIGLDQFALESDPLWQARSRGVLHRHFMGYTDAPARSLIGLGVSALGDSGDALAQNDKDLQRYQEWVASGRLPLQRGHLLSAEDRILRAHILRLITVGATDWEQPCTQTPHLRSVHERLAAAQADGLVELSSHACRVTERGWPFLRALCLAFDARGLRRSSDRSQAHRAAVGRGA
jgi:oxygen-independent coproporphyrinogen-3 oxidase